VRNLPAGSRLREDELLQLAVRGLDEQLGVPIDQGLDVELALDGLAKRMRERDSAPVSERLQRGVLAFWQVHGRPDGCHDMTPSWGIDASQLHMLYGNIAYPIQ
jgi:hypothetical protein